MIGAVRQGKELSKVEKTVVNAIRMAQKAYVTVVSTEIAFELAGIAAVSGKSLIKDVSSLARLADVWFSTRSRKTADVASGKII